MTREDLIKQLAAKLEDSYPDGPKEMAEIAVDFLLSQPSEGYKDMMEICYYCGGLKEKHPTPNCPGFRNSRYSDGIYGIRELGAHGEYLREPEFYDSKKDESKKSKSEYIILKIISYGWMLVILLAIYGAYKLISSWI